MSVTIFENASYDKILIHLSTVLSVEHLQAIISPDIQLFKKIKKAKISTWSQLQSELTVEADLFGFDELDVNTNTEEVKDYLVRAEGLKVDKSSLAYLDEISKNHQSRLFIFSNDWESLDSEVKKEAKKQGVQIVSLKTLDKSVVADLLEKYSIQKSLKIDYNSKKIILENAASYQQIIDLVDVLCLVDNQAEYLSQTFTAASTPIFMLPFNLNEPDTTAKRWLKSVPEEDLQLAMSLVHTKLEKGGQSESTKKALKSLIQTDQKIKTTSKVAPLTFWKLFLWQLQKK
jgi:hypothetical protein